MAKKRSARRRRSARKPGPRTARREPPPAEQDASQPAASRRDRPRNLRDLWWAAGLTVLAGLHRTAFLLSGRDRAWPFTVFYEGDSKTFFHFARAILAGEVYDSGIPFHPPGFPYFLAAVHRLLGAGAEAAEIPHLGVKLTLAWVSSLAVGLLFLLVRPYLGRPIALVAALLAVYHFGLYVIAVAPVSEGLYLTLLMLVLLLWSRGLDHPLAAPDRRPRHPALAGLSLGILLGLLALIRAESAAVALLLMAAGIFGWLRKSEESRWRRLAPWVLVAVGWGLAVTPWTLRNARQLSAANQRLGPDLAKPLPTFVPLTLYGPLNLALANNPQADGSFSRDYLSSQTRSGQLQLTNPQHLRFLLHGDAMAGEYIRQYPGDFARLVLKKWKLFFRSWRLGWTQWNFPGGLAGRRNPVDMFAPHSGAAVWLIAPLVLAGGWLCLRQAGPSRRWGVLVLLLAAAALAVVALFFGYVRQGLLLVPFWLTFAATALVAAGRWLHGAAGGSLGRKRLSGLAAAFVLALLLLESWGATADRNFHATGTTLPGRQVLNPDLPVELEPLPAEP